MKRHHVITSVCLLILPVIVIYGLTNYGFENDQQKPVSMEKVVPEKKYTCQKKAKVQHARYHHKG